MNNPANEYATIDPGLAPLFRFLSDFSVMEGMIDGEEGLSMTVEQIKINMPIDLDVVTNADWNSYARRFHAFYVRARRIDARFSPRSHDHPARGQYNQALIRLLSATNMNLGNEKWNLQSFINSLVIELDRARDSLAVKALNQPLSYSVKDLSIDLQVFPEYDGDVVQFKTAKPGESGSSKITMQLVSTSDRAIRESSRAPVRVEEGKIDSLPIDNKQKKALEKIGVRSVKDLERMEQQKINMEQVTDGQVDYAGLARMIDQARRGENPPTVTGLSLHESGGRRFLAVQGENLSLSKRFEPRAFLNKQKARVIEATPKRIVLELEGNKTQSLSTESGARSETMHIALDEETILKLKLNI